MGFLIHEELLCSVDFKILDESQEDILWIQVTSNVDDAEINCSICYLPPDYSTRNINTHAFFDNLSTQTYMYHNDSSYFVCGDLKFKVWAGRRFYRRG